MLGGERSKPQLRNISKPVGVPTRGLGICEQLPALVVCTLYTDNSTTTENRGGRNSQSSSIKAGQVKRSTVASLMNHCNSRCAREHYTCSRQLVHLQHE